MSKLQDIARERNWLKWFVAKPIHLYGRNLVLSYETYQKQKEVNSHIRQLQDMIDVDWNKQREEIKALTLSNKEAKS